MRVAGCCRVCSFEGDITLARCLAVGALTVRSGFDIQVIEVGGDEMGLR